jgi:putative Holliday junction resolvase
MPASTSQTGVNRARVGVTLAIDYGQKRLGLALSDELGLTSRPFATWTRTNRRRDLSRLRELVRQRSIQRIVIGLPLCLDGTPSEMSAEARGFAGRLAKALGLPVEMMDERLSSWEAKQMLSSTKSPARLLRRAEHATRKRVPAYDDVAASIILRDYLNRAHIRTETGN